jgi:hypothetical protein
MQGHPLSVSINSYEFHMFKFPAFTEDDCASVRKVGLAPGDTTEDSSLKVGTFFAQDALEPKISKVKPFRNLVHVLNCLWTRLFFSSQYAFAHAWVFTGLNIVKRDEPSSCICYVHQISRGCWNPSQARYRILVCF